MWSYTTMTTLLIPPPAVHLDSIAYEEAIDAIDLSPVNPAGDPADREEGVPLDEWLIGQRAFWLYCFEERGHDYLLLVANTIERIAKSVRFHRCKSVAELLQRSPVYHQADLDRIETPADRPLSPLASALDSAVEDYLVETGIAARLVAWAILGVAEEADYFHADTLEQFTDSKAAWEMAQLDAAEELAF